MTTSGPIPNQALINPLVEKMSGVLTQVEGVATRPDRDRRWMTLRANATRILEQDVYPLVDRSLEGMDKVSSEVASAAMQQFSEHVSAHLKDNGTGLQGAVAGLVISAFATKIDVAQASGEDGITYTLDFKGLTPRKVQGEAESDPAITLVGIGVPPTTTLVIYGDPKAVRYSTASGVKIHFEKPELTAPSSGGLDIVAGQFAAELKRVFDGLGLAAAFVQMKEITPKAKAAIEGDAALSAATAAELLGGLEVFCASLRTDYTGASSRVRGGIGPFITAVLDRIAELDPGNKPVITIPDPGPNILINDPRVTIKH